MIVQLKIIKNGEVWREYKYMWPQKTPGYGPELAVLEYSLDTNTVKHHFEYSENFTVVGHKTTTENGFAMFYRGFVNVPDRVHYIQQEPDADHVAEMYVPENHKGLFNEHFYTAIMI